MRILLGASALAIAAALERPLDTVIVERGTRLAPEWLSTMLVTRCAREPKTELGRSLKGELIERKLLDARGALYAPPVSFVLANRLLERGCKVRLLTEFAGVRREGEGVVARLFDADGFCELRADEVIDTRALHPARKYLCAVMAAPSGTPLADGLTEGLHDDEAVWKMPLPLDADWPSARNMMHERRGGFPGWNVSSMASEWTYEYDAVRPWESASYPDFLSAVDGGALCAKNDTI